MAARRIPSREPVAAAAVVRIIAYVLILTGFDLDPEMFAATVLPAVELVAGLITRASVTPVADG